MRATNLLWVCGIVLALSGSVRAGDREMALEVIDKAIKAHGGADGLNKTLTAVRTGSVKQFLGAMEVTFTAEVTLGLPGRFRIDATTPDKSLRILTVLNSDRGWRSSNGMAMEVSKEAVEELQEEAHVEWVATLVPLRKEGFDLAPITGKMVDGKPTMGVKVTRKGYVELRLYFDKESGLLVKIERKARAAGLILEKEYVLSDFKDFDGVKLPARRTELINGKKFAELTSATHRFPSKVDESMFAKP